MQIVLIVFLFVALAIDLFYMGFAVTRQDRKRSLYFTALTGAFFLYTLGYLLEITATSEEAVMTALTVENLGIPMIAPLLLLTVVSLYYAKRVRPWMLWATLAYGVFMFILVFSNNYHHLYYSSQNLVYEWGLTLTELGHGPFYMVQQGVTTGLMLLAFFLMTRRYLHGSRKLRVQIALLFTGTLLGFAGNLINFANILPVKLDPTPFAFTVGLALVSIVIFHHRIMDIVPLSIYAAVRTMGDSMIVFDKDGEFLFCNESARRLFPLLQSSLEGRCVFEMKGWPGELSGPLEAGMTTFAIQDEAGQETTHRSNTTEILDERGRRIGWTMVVRDITDITSLMHKLEELATTDALTGILNRRQFLIEVERKMQEAARKDLTVGWIMYDIDRFKKVNDTHGHSAGDYVLCQLAEIVKRQLRPYDIFARFGGEEFIICCDCQDEKTTALLAERLRVAMEQSRIVYKGVHIPVTASFGVVQVPPEADLDEATHVVDEALYRAKAEGRNRVEVGHLEVPPVQ